MKRKISQISILVNKKINSSSLNNKNYISTENLLPNFSGYVPSSSIPNNKVTKFVKGDILLSNIRPYFKKIFFPNFNGGCSNDIIVIRPIKNIINKFLYYALNVDTFINYYISSCQGTKMPRGNKNDLLEYIVDVPSFTKQQHIVNTARILI